MPVYADLYDIRYSLKTLDVDFAVHIAHRRKQMRADLDDLIVGLGFTDFFTGDGIRKFTASGYEVEFIAHRPGNSGANSIAVKEWNVSALPLPFIDMLVDFSEEAVLGDFSIRFPIPEAFFLHKLIVSYRRLTDAKRIKDLEQCRVLAEIVRDDRLRHVANSRRFSKATCGHIRTAARVIQHFPHRKAVCRSDFFSSSVECA